MAALPEYVTPKALAEHFGASERFIRCMARKLGACLIMGNKMFLLPQHVTRLIEELTPCPSNSPSAAKSGTSPELLLGNGYDALQKLRTAKSQNASAPKRKRAPGQVISMDRGRS